MTTTINVSVADLLQATDLLLAGCKGDACGKVSHKRLGYPATILPEYGAITIAVQLSHGTLRVTIPAELTGEGFDEFTFSLGVVSEARKALGKGSAALELGRDSMLVKASGVSVQAGSTIQFGVRLPTYAGEPARKAEFTMKVAALPWAAKAAAKDDTRPVLTMVHCGLRQDEIELLGADGFRLHIAGAEGTVERWDTAARGLTSPAEMVPIPDWLVASIAKAKAAEVKVGAAWWTDPESFGSRATVLFRAGDLPAQADVSNWPLSPDFNVVITAVPEDALPVVGLAEDLIESLAEVRPIARETAGIFRVSADDGTMVIEATAAELGTVRRRVVVNGEPFPFAANVDYWLEALGKPAPDAAFSIAMDRAHLRNGAATTPIRLLSGHPWGTGKAIIMPMHIAR